MARIDAAPKVLAYWEDWDDWDISYLNEKEKKRYYEYVNPMKENKKLVMTELYRRRVEAL